MTAVLLVSGTLILTNKCGFVDDPPTLACASSAWNKIFDDPTLLVVAVGALASTVAMIPFITQFPPCFTWCVQLGRACTAALECVVDKTYVAMVLSSVTLAVAAYFAATISHHLNASDSTAFAHASACFVCPNKNSTAGNGLLWGGVACAAVGFVTSCACSLHVLGLTSGDKCENGKEPFLEEDAK